MTRATARSPRRAATRRSRRSHLRASGHEGASRSASPAARSSGVALTLDERVDQRHLVFVGQRRLCAAPRAARRRASTMRPNRNSSSSTSSDSPARWPPPDQRRPRSTSPARKRLDRVGKSRVRDHRARHDLGHDSQRDVGRSASRTPLRPGPPCGRLRPTGQTARDATRPVRRERPARRTTLRRPSSRRRANSRRTRQLAFDVGPSLRERSLDWLPASAAHLLAGGCRSCCLASARLDLGQKPFDDPTADARHRSATRPRPGRPTRPRACRPRHAAPRPCATRSASICCCAACLIRSDSTCACALRSARIWAPSSRASSLLPCGIGPRARNQLAVLRLGRLELASRVLGFRELEPDRLLPLRPTPG